MDTFKRYINLYKQYLRMAVKVVFLFRVNSFGLVMATTLWSFLNISTIILTTRQITTVFGYTADELVAIGAVQVIFLGIFHMLFSKNIDNLPEIINKGKLDMMLLRPVDDQFSVSLICVRPIAFIRVMIGIVMLAYLVAVGRLVAPTLGGALLFGILLMASEVLIYSVWYIVATSLIWFPTMSNIVELLYMVNVTSRYPYDFFREIAWWVALLTFPFSIALVVPLHALMGKGNLGEYVTLIIASALFFTVARVFWRYSLRHYTSASN